MTRLPGPSWPEAVALNASFLLDAPGTLATLHRRYGSLSRLRLGPSDTVFVAGPEGNRLLFGSGPDAVQAGPVWRRILPFYEGALLTLDGPEHARRRRLLQPVWDPAMVGSYLPIFLDTVREQTQSWNGPIDLYAETERVALTNATRALMGHRLPASAYQSFFGWHRAIAAMILGVPGLDRVPGTRRWRGRRARERMWRLVAKIVCERRADPGSDALSSLVAAAELSEGEMMSDAFALFAAGHATMAAYLTFSLAAVAARPDLCERLRDEQERVLGDGPPGMTALGDLPFTAALLREVERLYPPLPCVARTAMRDLEIAGYRLPAGVTLMAGLWLGHRDPAVFPDPFAFDPDRFLPGRNEHRRQYALVGFGGGSHQCVGMTFAKAQAALVLHAVIRHFRLGAVALPEVRFRPFAVPATRIVVPVARARGWSW